MSRTSITARCLALFLCAHASAEQPIHPIPGQPLPVPPPPVRLDPSRFGPYIHPVHCVGAPPQIHGDRGDHPLDLRYQLQLAPGEKVFVPSGRNEPLAILDQSIGQVEPTAPTLMHRFDAGSANGWSPADTDIAVAAGYVCQVLNDDYIVFDKCGNQLLLRDINDLLPVFNTTYTVYSPKICWDAWNHRWLMTWHARRNSDQQSKILLFVSNNTTPIGLPGSAWFYYAVEGVQESGTADASFADSYDLGYSDDYIYMGGDQFRFSGSFRWSRVCILDKAEIYNALPAPVKSVFNFNNPDGTAMRLPRAVKQLAAYPAQDALFVNSRRTGGNLITKWYVTDPFGTANRTAVDISVADYDLPPDIIQPNASTLDTGDCRIVNAVQSQDVAGGTGTFLYTALHEAYLWGGDTVNRAACRLYQFNTANNAVLLDRIFGGPNLYYTFPTVAADFANNAYWVFARGGATEFQGVRAVETDAGTFVNSSTSIQPGSGNTFGTTWGRYLGASLDHDDGFTNARIWVTGPHALIDSWDSTIASISNYTRGTLSVIPNTDFNVTGDLGGTFTTNTLNYIASNTGQTGLTYNVLETQPWLTTSRTTNNQLYSATQGTLATVNTAQPVGFYSGTITFTDCALNGVTHVRNVSLTVRPLNNLCSRAIPLNPGTITASNLHADGSDLTSCGGTDTKDVWYAFIAPCSGTLQVDTLDTPANTDSTLAAFNACGSAQIACNDNFNSLRSRIRIPVTSGNTYYFRLAGYNGIEGTWQLFLGYLSDLNRDGQNDFFDYLDFVADFSANDPRADFNSDGVIDFFDYLDFVADFASAC